MGFVSLELQKWAKPHKLEKDVIVSDQVRYYNREDFIHLIPP